MATGTRIEMKNPFRANCKLHKIFECLADGEEHYLEEITKAAYPLDHKSPYLAPILRRRTASALRTIRSKSGLDMNFDGACYRLVEKPEYSVSCEFNL